MGFEIFVPDHASKLFDDSNMRINIVKDVDYNGKGVIDYITNKEVKMVMNVPQQNGNIGADDVDYLVRRRAVEFGVPIITNLELAKTLVNIIEDLDKVEEFEFKK